MNQIADKTQPSRLATHLQAQAEKRTAPPAPDRSATRPAAAVEQPERASAAAILRLQRMGGNRAVQRLLAQQGVQAKLMVGPADDPYEREADRVAETVMRSSTPGASGASGGLEVEDDLQRQAAAPAITPLVQRHALEAKPGDVEVDPEELRLAGLQRQAAAGQGEGFEAGAALEDTLNRRAGHGQPLDEPVRTEMEAHMGADFGGVTVHTDGEAARLNRSVSANAFTHGTDIYFGAGQFAPGSGRGKFLLAHELTHVAQQSGDRVRRRRVQRANIGRGQALPDLGTATQTRTSDKINPNSRVYDPKFGAQVARFQVQKFGQALADDVSAKYMVAQALGAGGAAKVDNVLRDIRAAYVAPIQTAADLIAAEEAAKDHIRTNFAGPDRQERLTVVGHLRPLAGTPEAAATEFFAAKRAGMQLGQAYLPDDVRANFSTALKQLPSVQALLNPGQPPTGGPVAVAEWRDPGKLSDKIQVKPSKGIPDWLSRRRATNELPKFKAKIDRVDQWLRALIEPDILKRVPRPNILMHTRGRMKIIGSAKRFFFVPDPTGYRPSAGGGNVDLSFDEVFAVMAHEMGHAIEDFLPMKSWHDMNLLLERRHSDKVGGSREARTGATFWTSGKVNIGPLENEGRYAGRYVTGKYTSTAYDDSGNAEVFSQAMEFFAKPGDALKLIEGDPQHAGIVLRSIRPAEYKALAALRAFDQYLPTRPG